MGTRKTLRVPLRVVFYRDGDSWIAHCLEFDLLGDGKTKPEALDLLTKAIAIQAQASVEHNNPANLFSPSLESFPKGHSLTRFQLTIRM